MLTPQLAVSLEKMDDLFGVTELVERKTAAMEQGENHEVDDKAGATETRIERV